MTDNDFVEHFDDLPEEISSDEENTETPPKSSFSRDKHRLAKRRRLEELLEEKRLVRELSDFNEDRMMHVPYYEDDRVTDSFYSETNPHS